MTSDLFEGIRMTCVLSESRLFIDSSTKSLKTILLHTRNKCLCLPVAHSAHLKQNYENVKNLLEALKKM